MAESLFPDVITSDLAEKWFGERFNANGQISKFWLALDRFPHFEGEVDRGGAKLFRFADGTVIRRPANGGALELLKGASDGQIFPDGVDRALAAEWYGSAENGGQTFAFDENSPVGKLWLKLGRFPKLVWTDDFGDRTYFRFADGTVIWRNAQTDFNVLGANTDGRSTFPDGMDENLAELWFGNRFDANGQVSKLWLKVGQLRKQFPTFEGDEQTETGQFFRFANGMTFRRAEPGQGPILIPQVPKLETGRFSTRFEFEMDKARMVVTQGPFMNPTHGRCDCYDFGIDVGTPLYSFAPGRVTVSEDTDDVYRPAKVVVQTKYGDILYAHLSRRDVVVGEIVDVDTQLGLSGTENGPHLHLQLNFGFSPLDMSLPEILADVGFNLANFEQ